MADDSGESCSFHEMGLDDRLVKVNNILAIKIKCTYCSILIPYFVLFYKAIAKLNWSQPSPIQVRSVCVPIQS